jgi:tol-pal system protein YbgF
MMKKITAAAFCVLSITLAASTIAVFADDAPVVDVTQGLAPAPAADNNNAPQPAAMPQNNDDTAAVSNNAPAAAATPTPDLSSMSSKQRAARVEQQVENLVQMNLPQQITDLQQTIQQMQGQLQSQAHDLKVLSDQQRSFYQDLDQRISQLKNGKSAATASSNTLSSHDDAVAKNATDEKSGSAQVKDTSAYQEAFAQLTKKQYEEAKDGFQNYLHNYPNGQFLMNAYYWLGEINLIRKNYIQAENSFQTMLQRFPKSEKTPDAKLKLAMIHFAHGKKQQAKNEFLQIKKQYPGSTAAQLANIQLQQFSETTSSDSSPPSSDASNSP